MSKKICIGLLILILVIKFFLNLYGLSWGLPDRWNIDESVAETLRMIADLRYYSPEDLGHPTFYKYVLGLFLGIYLAFLKITDYPLDTVQQTASISWIHLASSWPGFCFNIYLMARFLSVVFGLIGVVLVYKIGSLSFSRRAGLLAAASLSLSVGYMDVNNFAKNTSLVVLLTIISLYFSLRALYGGNFKRDILLAFFTAGLAFATKLDGGITIIFPITAFILDLLRKKDKTNNSSKHSIFDIFRSHIIYLGFGLFLLGVFIGWPLVFINPKVALASPGSHDLLPQLAFPTLKTLLGKAIVTAKELLINLGPYLGLTAFISLFYSLFIFRQKYILFTLILTGLIAYLTLGFFLFISFEYSYTKHTILAIPLLSFFSGYGLDRLLTWNRFRKAKVLKVLGILIIFGLSFLYTLNGASVFAKWDTRYQSTQWLLTDTLPEATIEHIQQMDWLYSSKVWIERTILFFNRNSKTYSGSFYNRSTLTKDEIESYMKSLRTRGPKGDFFIFAAGKEVAKTPRFLLDSEFLKEYSYKIVKFFSYSSNFWLRPKPDYTAPTIYILKRDIENSIERGEK